MHTLFPRPTAGARASRYDSRTQGRQQLLHRACRGILRGLEGLEGRQLLTTIVDWPMNEGPPNTTLLDRANGVDQAFDQTGELSGATWVADRDGGTDPWAINLDGVNDSVGTSESFMEFISGTASVSFWLKTTATGNDNPRLTGSVVGSGNTDNENSDIFWGFLDSSGRIALQVAGPLPTGVTPAKNTVRSLQPVNDGAWHHVTMTRDAFNNGEIKIYVDGFLNDSGFANTGLRNTSTQIREVGQIKMRLAPDRFFNGQLDEFRIDNEALTAQQVATLFDPLSQPPQAPQNVTVTYTGARAIKLSWTDGPGSESYYEVQTSTNGTDWGPTQVLTGTSGFVTGLTPSTNYFVRMRAINPFGQSPYTGTVAATTTAVPTAGTGNGVLGIYYDEGGVAITGSNPAVINPASNFNGRFAMRQDPAINFNWGTGQPHPAIGPDNFSVRWLGQVQPLYNEPYRFCVSSDDGASVFLTVNGVETQIINDPTFHGLQAAPGLCSAPIELAAGQRYDLRVEQFEGGGDAGAILRWQSPSQPTEAIPPSQLYQPPAGSPPTGSGDSLAADAVNPFTVRLSWVDNATNELGYRILRSENGASGTFVEVARVAGQTYDDAVFPNKTYHYKVQPVNAGGTGTESGIDPATTPALPTGPGLLGIYHDDLLLSGAPELIRVDTANPTSAPARLGPIHWPDIDATPNPPLATGVPAIDDGLTYSIRWVGTFTPPTTGVYTFFTRTDDAVRLWVNGERVISAPDANNFATGRAAPAAPGDATRGISLTGGVGVPIMMDYNQGTGGAAAELRWQGPGVATPQILPTVFNGQQILTATQGAPTPTANLSATVGAIAATLKWSHLAKNEMQVRVEQSDDGGVSWFPVQTFQTIQNPDGTPVDMSLFVNSLTPNKTYSFRVVDSGIFGESVSNVVTVTTTAIPASNGTLAPSTGDTNLTNEGNVDWVHWGFPSNADGFNARGTPAQAFNQGSSTYVAFEAESNVEIADGTDRDGATWQIANPAPAGTASTASGGGALVNLEPDNVLPPGGFATYRINFTQLGDYKLYTRRMIRTAPAPTGNSAYAPDALDQPTTGTYFEYDNDEASRNDYVWTSDTPTGNVIYRGVTPGTHTFTMATRENGYVLDRIVFSLNHNLSPAELDALVNSTTAPASRVGGPITDATTVGNATVRAYDASGKTFTWSNGIPNVAASNTDDAIAVSGTGNGFRFTVPASPDRRRLRIYVGVENTRGQLTATLSDGSMAPFVDSALVSNGEALKTGVYAIDFKSELDNQTLTVEWTALDPTGSVILQAATLSDIQAAAPTNVTAAPASFTAIDVSWTDVSDNENGFRIERSADGIGGWVVAGNVARNTTKFRDTGRVPNTRYFYRVIAVNAAGDSAASNVANATTIAAPQGTLTGSQAAATGDTNLTTEGNLDWAHWGHDNNPAGFNTREIPGFEQGANNYIAFEAEAAQIADGPDNDGATWQVMDGPAGTSTTASGGRVIYSPEPDTGLPPVGGFATYRINVSQAGDYKLYTRRMIRTGPAQTGNSAFAPNALDQSTTAGFFEYDNDDVSRNQYIWTSDTPTGNVIYRDVTVGTHTFTMATRENGYILDRIVFSLNHNLTPQQLDALLNSQDTGAVRQGGPITNVTPVGTGTVQAVAAPAKTFTWSDGTPTVAVTGTDDGIAVTGTGNGFRFTVPASSTATRRLKVYVGVNNSSGQLTASLSDNSMAPFGGTLSSNGEGLKTAVFTIDFKSGLPDQNLTVEWVATNDSGPVILQAAAWQEFMTVAPATNVDAVARSRSTVDVTWTDVATAETAYRVERSTDGTTWTALGTLPADTSSFRDINADAGTTYQYRVVATNLAGDAASTADTVTTPAPLQSPWKDRDIGNGTNPSMVGDASFDAASGTWTVKGGGSDVWDPDDHFHYVYQPVTGNASITAQVVGLDPTDPWAKAGVMFREDLSATSQHAFLIVSPQNGTRLQGREQTAGPSFNVDPAFGPNNTGWLRLERVGDVFNAYYSADGVTWPTTPNATRTIDMNDLVFVGLATTAHNNGALNTSVFRNVNVVGSGPTEVTVTGTAGNDTFYLKRNAGNVDVYNNATGTGAPIQSIPFDGTSAIRVNGMDGDDTVVVDASGGQVFPGTAGTIDGGAGADTIRYVGNSGNASFGDGSASVGGSTINHTGAERHELGTGTLGTLGIDGNARVKLAGDNGQLSVTGITVSPTSRLDLGTNDMLVKNATIAGLDPLLASARNGATRWQGPGIGTTAAGPLNALAPVQQGADTLVKYTYNGDANGDGRVNADDYFRIDQGFLAQPQNPTYNQGDFNYDNVVNADDYFLIDQAFLGQGAPLASGEAAAAAASSSTSSTAAVEETAKTAAKRRSSGDSLFGSKRIEKRARSRRNDR